jgi:YidC/Oxa1 family membrane protein insertase
MSAFYAVPVDAAYHVVSWLAQVLSPLPGGLAAAAAIVLFTMAVRLLVLPLSFRAARGLEAQARVAPQAQALRQKYARQPDRMQRELAALYQAEGTSAFAGCLPLLLQWPFLSVMYLLFRSPVVDGQRNLLLTHDLFGATLGSHWLGAPGPLSAQGAVFAVLFVLIAAASLVTAYLTRRRAAAAAAIAGPPGATAVTRALGWVTPFISVVIAAFVPLAAGLYLVTTAVWTLGERFLLRRSSQPRPAEPLAARTM